MIKHFADVPPWLLVQDRLVFPDEPIAFVR